MDSFDVYICWYTHYTDVHCLDSFDIYVCLYKYIHVYIYIQMYIVHCWDSFDIYAAGRLWVWRRWSQTGQRAISQGRSQDNAMLCRVVICSGYLLLFLFGCFAFSIMWVYVNIKQFDQGIMRYVYFCDIYIE